MKENTIETLEVRWFEPGEPPAEVKNWFFSNCLQETVGLEARTDLYLYLPESTSVSYKWRQGNLELKWRQAELGKQEFGNAVWSGNIERWCKWLDRQEVPQNQLDNFLPAKFWIEVSKQRQHRSEAGVTGELTKLKIDSHLWWSIAFEMSGGDRNGFFSVLNRVSKTYCGPKLSVDNCFGYPQLLAATILKSNL